MIGDEGEREAVLGLEFSLGVLVVLAHAKDLKAAGAEGGKGVADAASLLGAAGRVGLWVEIDKGNAFFVGIGKGDRGAVLVDGGDVGGRGAYIQGAGWGEAEEGKETHDEEDAGEGFHRKRIIAGRDKIYRTYTTHGADGMYWGDGRGKIALA
jgi:hypothetical protein